MNSTKILDAVKLPTLSRTLQEILKLEGGNPFTLTANMRRIIEKDPLLSAHILKVANSSFYGFSQQVRTISHAQGLLGTQRIKQIAFSFSIFDYFKRIAYRKEYRQTFHQIIKKALLQSSLALLIAQRIGEQEPEEFYMSTLLNDIGQIVLFLYDPGIMQEIYHPVDHIVLPREQERYGINHRDMGMAFCLRHQLPEQIALSVSHHTEKTGEQLATKVSHIANSMAEMLMQSTPSEIPRHMEELNQLCVELFGFQLSSLSEGLRTLPKLLDAYIGEFPELSDDLQEIAGKGSALILSLMNEQIGLVTEGHRMDDVQKKIAKEKLFLSHMLNLSYYLSSLISPEKIRQSVFEYFENFITDFSIAFLIREEEGNEHFTFIENASRKGRKHPLSTLPPLAQALESHGTTRLEPQAMKTLGFAPDETVLAFPIAFNQILFGFLLLNLGRESFRELDLELSYIQILSNIMANSFQNYDSFRRLNNELHKKKLLTHELVINEQRMELNRQEITSLQKNESLTGILPVIFHKLKNKLTPILGYTQILLARCSDETTRSRLVKIERNAEELTQQLNHLRSYFIIEPPPMESINPNRILSKTAEGMKQAEAENGIDIRIQLDKNIREASINAGQFETLIENLLGNAVLAVRQKPSPRGTVEISTQAQDDGGFQLIVRDDGIGIPEDQLSLVWLPFHAGFPDRPGLGLAVCHRIIEYHHAHPEIESETGKGTRFRISFPPPQSPQAETKEPPEGDKAEEAVKTILIIDDEEYLLELMKDVLEAGRHNLTISLCSTGQAAIDLLKTQSFDLIISDIHMPEINGVAVYEELKKHQLEHRLIMVTGDPYPTEIAAFLKSSGIPYLKKPFELMEFKRLVLEKLT